MEIDMDLAKVIAVIGSIIVMIFSIFKIHSLLISKEQGYGQNTTKIICLTLLVPSIVIISVISDFSSEAIAALLGTVAGYALSHEQKT